MFLSEHPEDSNCLLAAETHDSQTKLIQSKIQLTVFKPLGQKATTYDLTNCSMKHREK